MPNNDYVKPPTDFAPRSAAEAVKSAYSYLHPNYRKRKLIHLIVLVPILFIIYGTIWGLIFMKITGLNDYTMPVFIKGIDLIFIIVSTIAGAYFYPFSLWWYKQSFLGSTLNNMFFIGSVTGVILRKIGTVIFGIILAGVLAPITGPLALRNCKKKNMLIGDACDFE